MASDKFDPGEWTEPPNWRELMESVSVDVFRNYCMVSNRVNGFIVLHPNAMRAIEELRPDLAAVLEELASE